MIERVLPYAIAFAGSLILTLILTPLVREMNRRLGMVDKPDPRRINKVPIPRGGGLAVLLGVLVVYSSLVLFGERVQVLGGDAGRYWRCTAIAVFIALVGLADDKFSLKPKVKLAGQVAAAFLTWWWGDLGFSDLWAAIPAWLDCLVTVLWIVGAINAFNLIDGLDGLATGLALIATVGMAGALFFSGHAGGTLYYFAFAGALIGFLRYNFNPASVFLGDCGSMYIGYVLATLPLCSHTPNSFMASIGVPLLAMGVPIFDTSLAILRRSVRHVLNRKEDSGNGEVMTADVDHLHHRILRSVNLNQRKAAWALYGIAACMVATGFFGLVMREHAAGLWLLAVMMAGFVIFKDLARIELFDAGRLLGGMAHDANSVARRRWARAAVPVYFTCDMLIVIGAYFLLVRATGETFPRLAWTKTLPVRLVVMMAFIVASRTYVTIWARALASNFMRLIGACFCGAVASSVAIFFLPCPMEPNMVSLTIGFGTVTALAMALVRIVRGVLRDFFYNVDSQRLAVRKDVSRVLVYGAGLRYRAFRRELVRRADNANRVIVGMLDDDILLRGHYIGGIKVLGTLAQAPEIINATNADTVVVACEVTDEWMKVVRETLAPTGIRITHFTFMEKEIA